MRTRRLGRTGFACSEVGLGAMTLGSAYGPVSDETAIETVLAFLDEGGNFIDTARGYGPSELRLGAVLRRRPRESLVVCSKTHAGRDAATLGGVRGELEASLGNLGTDHLDVYYLHSPPTSRDGMLAALDLFDELKREGKIRAVGVSLPGPDVTGETLAIGRAYLETGRVDVVQLVYSILRQRCAGLFELARRHDVGVVARTTLENGFLTGRYTAEDGFSDYRRRWSPDSRKAIAGALAHLQSLIGELPPGYASLAQVAIAFSLAPPDITSSIVGAKGEKQVRANCAVGSRLPPLPADLVARLVAEFDEMTPLFNVGKRVNEAPKPKKVNAEAFGGSARTAGLLGSAVTDVAAFFDRELARRLATSPSLAGGIDAVSRVTVGDRAWTVDFTRSPPAILPAPDGDGPAPRCTVKIDEAAFLPLVNRKLRARVAMHDGRLALGGDAELAVNVTDALGLEP